MIETGRLRLRRWREGDAAAHRSIVVHPLVVRTLGGPPDGVESAGVVPRQNGFADATGSCFWAVEERTGGAMIGWCGVKPGAAGTPIEGLPEAGWTLHPGWWGRGLAREAAIAAIAHFWMVGGAASLFAITTPGNRASRGLMKHLGMRRIADADFDHPGLAAGDPLRRHVTYIMDRPGPSVRASAASH